MFLKIFLILLMRMAEAKFIKKLRGTLITINVGCTTNQNNIRVALMVVQDGRLTKEDTEAGHCTKCHHN